MKKKNIYLLYKEIRAKVFWFNALIMSLAVFLISMASRLWQLLIPWQILEVFIIVLTVYAIMYVAILIITNKNWDNEDNRNHKN